MSADNIVGQGLLSTSQNKNVVPRPSISDVTDPHPNYRPSLDPKPSSSPVLVSLPDSNEDKSLNDKSKMGSSQMLSLLDEFTKIYSDRLNRVEETAPKCDENQYLQNKVSLLGSWVRDLGEQNHVLVATVEELEREAGERVVLLQDKLNKMATNTRESCISLRDHHSQVSSIMSDKLLLERESSRLREELLTLEQGSACLRQENTNLTRDLQSIVQVMNHGRLTGHWEIDGFSFNCISPEEMFGTNVTSSRVSSECLKCSRSDYLDNLIDNDDDDGLGRKDSNRSSIYNLQDLDAPISRPASIKDLKVSKLKCELQTLQEIHEECNSELEQKEKNISELQSELSDIQRQLSIANQDVDHSNKRLQDYKERNVLNTLEITRKEELIQQLMSSHSPLKRNYLNDLEGYRHTDVNTLIKPNSNAETQLSENIDVLVSRLTELELDCDQLRNQYSALQESHSLCLPTINTLQQQLDKVTQNIITDYSTNKAKSTQTYSSNIRDLDLRSDNGSTNLSCNLYSKNSSLNLQVIKLENELTEKNILIRELQNHLATSRQELQLKDETLDKVEDKLETSRREGDYREDRFLYLTSQLTHLQLEIGRTHGHSEQLQRQVTNKTELVQKLEIENSSLSHQLNEKSNSIERLQKETTFSNSDVERLKKQGSEQRLTIGTLQDALVATKQTCDKLRLHYRDSDNNAFNFN